MWESTSLEADFKKIFHYLQYHSKMKNAFSHTLMISTKFYLVLHNNMQCIGEVGRKQRSYLDQCLDTFLQKTRKDPDNVCRYAQSYVFCYVAPFENTCKNEVGHTMCELLVIGLSMPQCQYACPS